MAGILDPAYRLSRELIGPDSGVPWWAWTAFLAMIFWGLLVPDRTDEAAPLHPHGLDRAVATSGDGPASARELRR
jgi:hypothetical protein